MAAGTLRPSLSVVVVAHARRTDLLLQCLRALAAQPDPACMEVLVVSPIPVGPAGEFQALAARFPGSVTVIEAAGLTIPHMRRVGIAHARGDVVALIEDDCIVAPGWAAVVLDAHRGEYVAVGGAVEPGSYTRSLDWAAFLSDYARFMLPFGRGENSRLPGNNVSYKRVVIDELLAMTAESGLQETFVHEKWHADGKLMLAEPDAVVRNEHRWHVRDVIAVPFHHGRAFGGQRSHDWNAIRRAVFALGSVALPALHVARIVGRGRRHPRVPVMRALPWLCVFGMSWAVGECLGYAAGPGSSLERWQ